MVTSLPDSMNQILHSIFIVLMMTYLQTRFSLTHLLLTADTPPHRSSLAGKAIWYILNRPRHNTSSSTHCRTSSDSGELQTDSLVITQEINRVMLLSNFYVYYGLALGAVNPITNTKTCLSDDIKHSSAQSID